MHCPKCQGSRLRKHGYNKGRPRLECKDCSYRFTVKDPPQKTETEYIETGNYATFKTNGRIHTLDALLERFNVDLTRWRVAQWRANSYEQASKGSDDSITVTPLYQVRADFERATFDPVEFAPIHPVRIDLPQKDPPLPGIRLGTTVLVLPDTQHGFRRKHGELDPFHDVRALDIALQIAQFAQPDRVVLLGDHLDLPDWSDKFLITPDMRDLTQAAIDALATWLGHLRLTCPKAHIDYLEGNHERRMSKAIALNLSAAYGIRKANQPDTLPVLSVPYLLGLQELGIHYHGDYPDGQVWLTDTLVCEHGDIAKNRSGSTSQAYLQRSHSTIVGHIHRHELLYYTEWGRKGADIRFAGSPGTLARVDGAVPAQSDRNNWQQSVWLVHLHADKTPAVEAIEIRSGRCNFRGQWLEARV